MRKLILILGLMLVSFLTIGQVGINNSGNSPDNSAMLDVSSITKGILIPRMSTVQRIAIISPSNGLMVYDTDVKCFFFFRVNTWVSLCDAAIGATGATGLPGVTGPQGVPGATGPQGVQGLNGNNGATGLQGITGPTGTNGTNGIAGPTGPTGPTGTASISCATANTVLKSDGTTAVCTTAPIYETVAGNVGIGNTTPTEKLDITGNVRFSKALMPNNLPGSSGQVLVSQGANNSPVWQSIGNVIQVLKSNSVRTLISSTSFVPITGLSINFTLTTNSTVMISTYGSLETISTTTNNGSGVIVQAYLDNNQIPDMFQTIDINDVDGFINTIAPWSMSNTLTLTAGNHVINIKSRIYMGDDFYAGGNTTSPNPNEGVIILTIIPQ